MIGYIYKITSPTGRVYIGQTTGLEKRKKAYKKLYDSVKKQSLLYASLSKYGFDNHEFVLIETVESDVFIKELLNSLEIYWIEFYKSNRSKYKDGFGLNLTSGGVGGNGYKHSKSSREKMSGFQKGKKGTPHTEEHKSYMREVWRLKLLNGYKKEVKPFTEEHKRKIGLKNKGKVRTPETKAAISNTLKSYICTDEHKKNIKEGLLKRKIRLNESLVDKI